MPGRVFITGGSGFVGTAVIRELLSRDYSVNALIHRGDLKLASDRVQVFRGDLFDRKALDEAIAGCDAAIHLVGIIMEKPSRGITFERIHHEGTRSVADAAKRATLRRFVHMSALGTRADAQSNYHKTKFRAEQYVRTSDLDWTIFRPSMIHGPQGELMTQIAKWARAKAAPFLFMPYFGAGPLGRGGAGMLQPVYVGDVARAFVDAFEKPGTIGEIYPIGGSERLTWPELHHAAAEAIVGKRRRVMALPAWKAKLLTHFLPASLLGFNHDQVIMSQEDNTTDLAKFTDDFGWEPRPFRETLKGYANEIR